jgi:hypothetical protein
MAKKIIHVNRLHLAMNQKDGRNRPVYMIREGSKTIYARGVSWNGPTVMVPQGRQLPCGARVWVETEAELEVLDPMTFAEARASS